MARVNLTDRFISSRKPAAPGSRDEYLDGLMPGLALRVTDRGHKSFVLIARYPLKPKNSTRRALGGYAIFIAKRDGTGLTQVTDYALNATHGVISPDGRHMVFAAMDPDSQRTRIAIVDLPER